MRSHGGLHCDIIGMCMEAAIGLGWAGVELNDGWQWGNRVGRV